jgi:hypothetical protein
VRCELRLECADSRLDAGPLLDYLNLVKAWLDGNPNEGIVSRYVLMAVVTILFTNDNNIDVSIWGEAFKSAGLDTLAYIPPFSATPADTLSWPTLGAILAAGKRIVVFMDSNANTAVVPYILPEFTYMWETPFDQTSNLFPCTVNRPASIVGQFPTGRLSVVNHFLDKEFTAGVLIPDTAALNVTNAASGLGSLGYQADSCSAIYGRYPNFMLVDCTFLHCKINLDYDVHNGSVFEVAARVNGVPYIPSKSVLAGQDNLGSQTNVAGVPSSASAKKVLPLFVILQLVFSVLTVAGALWLVHDASDEKLSRLEDRYTTLIRARVPQHAKNDSIASLGDDSAFATELESASRPRRHVRASDTVDLTSHAALMGRDGSARGSMDSDAEEDDADLTSLRRALDEPLPRQAGYLEHRRNSLFLSQ